MSLLSEWGTDQLNRCYTFPRSCYRGDRRGPQDSCQWPRESTAGPRVGVTPGWEAVRTVDARGTLATSEARPSVAQPRQGIPRQRLKRLLFVHASRPVDDEVVHADGLEGTDEPDEVIGGEDRLGDSLERQVRSADRRRVSTELGARVVEKATPPTGRLDGLVVGESSANVPTCRHAVDVPRVGVAGGEPDRPRPESPDRQGRVRSLDRARIEDRIVDPVIRSLVVNLSPVQERQHDRQCLPQPVDSLLRLPRRETGHLVVERGAARTDAELEPPA